MPARVNALFYTWALLLIVVFVLPANGRDLDGKWGRTPMTKEQREWLRGVVEPGTARPGSPGKSCCNDSDGEEVEEDLVDGIYRVRSAKTSGLWIDVPPAKVITEPNKWGQPIAWYWYGNDGQGKLQVRCFAPGAKG